MTLKKILGAAASALALSANVTLGCTGIILRSTDGVTVPARTMEFSFDIHSNILAVPAVSDVSAYGSK